MKKAIFGFLIFLFAVCSCNLLFAQQNNLPCREQEKFKLLDFWVENWDVYSGDQKVGTNSIKKILAGCAVIENWKSVHGSEGISIFYYYPKEERWKQVWVTENPYSNGGVKEKAHIETLENGDIRFQGNVLASSETQYLDRTTLKPLGNGHVEQIIEISSDDGNNWRDVFRYVQTIRLTQ